MKITATNQNFLKQKADFLVIGVGKKSNNRTKLPASFVKNFKGNNASLVKELPHKDGYLSLPVPTGNYKYVLLVNRNKEEVTASELCKQFKLIATVLNKYKAKSAVVDLLSLVEDASFDETALRLAAQSFGIANYKFNLGNKFATTSLEKISIISSSKAQIQTRAVKVGLAIAEGMRICKHLGEQPPNLLYPDVLAKYASKVGKANHLKVKVLNKSQLTKLKMNGILTVGQGSTRDPRLIVMQYQGASKSKAPICLIGKGITFDTGGNSIKPGNFMMDMKFDMCGAASVIGTLITVAKMKANVNVVGIIPSAENMLAGNSFRPDDVIQMMNGSSVEVLNTDAEGRLILADAITYAQKYHKPKLMIDAATLTGACLVALGEHRSGLMSTNDDLAKDIYYAGESSGDPCWRLPLDNEYDDLLVSHFADFANIGGGRNAGTITAACFLGRFVNKKIPWAHLDIAGSAWQNRRASGRPVPLLSTFIVKQAKLIKE